MMAESITHLPIAAIRLFWLKGNRKFLTGAPSRIWDLFLVVYCRIDLIRMVAFSIYEGIHKIGCTGIE
jgi:hypothetical protein